MGCVIALTIRDQRYATVPGPGLMGLQRPQAVRKPLRVLLTAYLLLTRLCGVFFSYLTINQSM